MQQIVRLARRGFGKALSGLFIGAGLLACAAAAHAGTLAMPDSTNNRLVLFSDIDGSVVNTNYFALGAGTTPVHAMTVGNEIWISEQIGDRVARYSSSGAFIGQIGGLDNVRGMALVGSTVYITNAGTNNGAPGNALVMVDMAGNSLGNVNVGATSPSPFGVLAHQGGLLVSSSSANDDLHRYTLAGASLGTFYNGTALNFGEQMDYAANGDIWVAGFSSNNLVRFNPDTGAIVGSFAANGARGVAQLGNGNVLWTSGTGVFVLDPGTGASTQVYAGGGRYLDAITPVPEPATVALWASGLGLMALRLRRRGRR